MANEDYVVRRLAEQFAALTRTVEGLKRTQQVTRSTVDTRHGTTLIGDVISDTIDTVDAVAVQDEQIRDIDDKGSADYDQWYETQENEYDNADAAHEAWMEAIAVNESVDEAKAEADQAAADALEAAQQAAEALTKATEAKTEAGAAQAAADQAAQNAIDLSAAAQVAAEAYAKAEAEAAEAAAKAAASQDATDKAAAAEAAAKAAAAADATAKANAAEAAAKADAAVAKAAADVAQAKADAAQVAADNVLFLAEGLYQVIPSVTEPTTSPTGALKQGDMWWVIGAAGTPEDGEFIGVKVYNGAAWVDRQLVANSLLVPGTVGNVLIENGAITGVKIAADAIDGKTITGAVVRTAATGQRLQLDSNGLLAYAADGSVTATLRSSDGGLDVSGMIRSRKNASTAEGAVVHPDGFGFSSGSGTPGEGFSILGGMYLDRGGRGLVVSGGPSLSPVPGFPNQVTIQGYNVTVDSDNIAFKGDTQWANFTRASGMVGTAQWRRYLGRIEIYIDYTNEVAGGGHVQLGTLPVAARPRRGQALMASGTNGPTATSYVDTGGVIRFRVAPNTTATAPLVTGSFIKD